jgi:hypothetical protein
MLATHSITFGTVDEGASHTWLKSQQQPDKCLLHLANAQIWVEGGAWGGARDFTAPTNPHGLAL